MSMKADQGVDQYLRYLNIFGILGNFLKSSPFIFDSPAVTLLVVLYLKPPEILSNVKFNKGLSLLFSLLKLI